MKLLDKLIFKKCSQYFALYSNIFYPGKGQSGEQKGDLHPCFQVGKDYGREIMLMTEIISCTFITQRVLRFLYL